jgi:hypothetical protein
MNNDEHVLSLAGYVSTQLWGFCPHMECLCGFNTGPCLDWEYAGTLLDTHIQEQS